MTSCGGLRWAVGAWQEWEGFHTGEHWPGSESQSLNVLRRESTWRHQGEEECVIYTSRNLFKEVNIKQIVPNIYMQKCYSHNPI